MWLIVDGNNWFAQCAFASLDYAKDNFMNRLRTVYRQIEHTRCVICWDEGITFRSDLEPTYKAHRSQKPEGFREQLRETRKIVAELGSVESVSVPGFEADDCVATLVTDAKDEGEKAVIFSQDRDLHQLLVAGTVTQVLKVERITKDRMHFFPMTAGNLFEQYGVHPWQWIDYRVLIGDSSDGIKGCNGIGPKTAQTLIQTHGDLEHFFHNPWLIKLTSKQRNTLLSYRDLIPNKRKMMTLRTDLMLPLAEAV